MISEPEGIKILFISVIIEISGYPGGINIKKY